MYNDTEMKISQLLIQVDQLTVQCNQLQTALQDINDRLNRLIYELESNFKTQDTQIGRVTNELENLTIDLHHQGVLND